MDNSFLRDMLTKKTDTAQPQQAQPSYNNPNQQKLSDWIDSLSNGASQPKADYPSKPQSIQDQISAMPNADKLSGFERWMYQKLPGFSQSSVGKALNAFSESPAGKLLGTLDVLAEATERTFGLAAQYRDRNPEEDFNLKDAWSAGSLFYDVSKLPTFSKDANGVYRIQLDSTAPGAYALTEARKLLEQGKSLNEVRDLMYGNMGALALRAQLRDTAGHVLVDPLNWMLGAVKPIEKLHALRNLALTTKLDVEEASKVATLMREAGRIDDALKVEQAISKAQSEGKALDRIDKFAIMLTGGQPYQQDVNKLGKAGKTFAKLNPFALTPQARASEMLDMVAANVGEYLVRPNWDKDPSEFISAINAAARGSVGGEWGHLAGTIQGRTVQGLLNNASANVKALGQEWEVYSKERQVLEMLSRATGQKVETLADLARKTPEVFFQRLTEIAKQPGGEELVKLIQSGQVDQKFFEGITKIPEDVALSAEKFYAKALVEIQDVAMKQSILQFGIKEKGVLTKWSDALKAWETLPFIKANPANMVRNVINNDVTLVGRGLFGTMTRSAIDNFWKDKYIPEVFRRGFSLAGEEVDKELAIPEKFRETLTSVLEGKGDNLAAKVKGAAGKVELGKADMSKLSGALEQSASRRATTNAWIDFHNKYWNPSTGFTSISKQLDPDTLEAMAKIDPNLARTLDEVAQSAAGDPKKFAELMGTQLEHNTSTIIKNTEDGLGFKLNDVLGPEVMARVQDGLPKAIQEGKVKDFVFGLRAEMEKHVDDMFNEHLKELPGIVKAQVQAGGPLQFHRIFGKAMEEMWAGNTEHAMRMSTINELLDYAQRTGDYKKVGDMWERIMADSENHFGRVWKKMDAFQQGLKEGATAAGVKYPSEVGDSFSQMSKGWKEFYDFRNTEYKAFFDARNAGQKTTKTLEQIQGEIESKFQKMVTQEDKAFQKIDDLMAKSIPDRTMRGMYMRFRDQVAELRTADREATTKFYSELRTADAKDAPDMWQAFWQAKTQRTEAIRKLEAQGSAALQGNTEAINQFLGQVDQGQANSIYGLASQYGIASRTTGGARNDRRILTTVNKYLKDTGVTERQIVENATLPEEVKKAFASWDDTVKALEQTKAAPGSGAAGAAGLADAEAVKAAKAAEKEARAAYEKVLEANHIDRKMMVKLVNKKEFMNVDQIPLDVAQKAFETRVSEQAGKVSKAAEMGFIPDAEKIFPDPMPIETAISEMNYGRSYAALDALTEETLAQVQTKARRLKDLPEDMQKKIMQWVDHVNDESSGFRAAATQYASFRRDSALLNYNRRTNFDNWAAHIAPFSFWTTHSMINWAVHSIDRPAMLATYLRTRKLFETAGLQDQNVPTRLKGQIRVGLPFTPDWMGDTFMNPMRVALPFDSWLQPWEQMQSQKFTQEGKTEQTLKDMLEKGAITEQQYNDAIQNKSGDVWDNAMGVVKEGGDNYDAMDFANAMMTPHAPLMWAYNAARGTPNEIGPFTPMSRTMRNVATMMGVKDWSNSPYNIEGRIRKEMGLPAYDKWDDYRVGREISNMAADGKYSMDDIKTAMEMAALVESGKMDSKDAVKQSKVYEEATFRANQEYAGGAIGTFLGILGIPVKAFPTGEQKQRELADQFSAAYKEYDAGNPDALTKFFDDHPEYESRLALFKKPEDRLKSFMVDNIWSRWNEMPKVNQDEMKDQLGPNFANYFVNKETRNYDSLTPEQMQIWLKLMGGKQIGVLSADTNALLELNQLKLTQPETAWRVQTFYDGRNAQFPDWYKLQTDYYKITDKNARSSYTKDNPQLKNYWDFRRKWMQSNPDLVRFLTDDPKQLKKYENVQRQQNVSVPTADEIRSNISPANMELLQQWSQGQTLPYSTDQTLEMLAREYGIPKRDLLGILTGK